MKKFDEPICEKCDSRCDSLFADIKGEEVNELSYQKTCNLYKKGQAIFYERNRPLGVYCLHKGRVKIYKTGFDGKEHIVRFGCPGDVLGYRALLSNNLYTASAMSLEDSVLCFIGKQYFVDLMKREPCISNKLLLNLCSMLGEAEKKMTSIAQKPVRERLAEALIALKETFNTDNNSNNTNTPIPVINLPREDLSNVVGTATETVIRLLSDFKKEGLIQVEGRKIKLLNIKGLIRIANLYD